MADIAVEMTEFRGVMAPAAFASADSDWLALKENAVALPAPWRVRYTVSGADAERWLNGMLTNNTAALASGEGNYSFLLSSQGRIQGDVTVFRTPDGYLLETDAVQAEKIVAWLDRYIIMDDVVLASDAARPGTVLLVGRRAPEVLEAYGVAHSFPAMTLQTATIANAEVQFYRDAALAIPAFWIMTNAEDTEAVLRALHGAGAARSGVSAVERLRIASGIPAYGQDITERDLPQETSQARALHFQKGCYLGQEIVERINSRGNVHRGLAGFTLDRAVPPDTPVMDDEMEIGRLTSVATLPASGDSPERHIAMGIVRTAAIAAHKPLTADDQAITPAALPFI